MSAFPDDRRDLAAMFAPLTRALIAREEPVLDAHGISMWGYIVLTAALPIARSVPDGQNRRQPGASFAPRVAVTRGGLLDQIVALLGRRPGWPA